MKRTQLYLTTLQMQIHIYQGDLEGAQHQLRTCIALTQKGAEYRPGFIRRAHDTPLPVIHHAAIKTAGFVGA